MFPSCIKSEHRFLTQKKVVILPTKTALKMSNILRIRQLCVVIFFTCLTGRFLGRHFGCRPLDPTLDIWSNFVKHFTSLQCLKGSQGFPRVTKGYQRLSMVTSGYHRLPQVNLPPPPPPVISPVIRPVIRPVIPI